MTNNLLFTSNNVGEAFAGQALIEYFGAEVFVGSSIEIKLQELSQVIYHEVADPDYYGATISYTNNKTYIALNSFHPLRTRYFTAAHELWHVLGLDRIENIDLEKAAERFAAALMMPESLIRQLWGRFDKQIPIEKMILTIADMASTPYRATVKRIAELKLPRSSKLPDHSESEWVNLRKKMNVPPSPLDLPLPFIQFTHYEQLIDRALDTGLFDPLSSSIKLAQFSPEKAQAYQDSIVQKLHNEQDGTDE